MTEVIHTTPGGLERLINIRLRNLQKRTVTAMERAAADAVTHIRETAPKAFGDLRSSVHVTSGKGGPKVVVAAPHAAAVEVGSRPHKPDIESLLAWVRLRGIQGLTPRGNLRTRFARGLGPTTPSAATAVTMMLMSHVVRARRSSKKSAGWGRNSPIDAPMQVAQAIAKKIEMEGTKPHWFVRDSLPVIAMRLAKYMRKAWNKS